MSHGLLTAQWNPYYSDKLAEAKLNFHHTCLPLGHIFLNILQKMHSTRHSVFKKNTVQEYKGLSILVVFNLSSGHGPLWESHDSSQISAYI